MIGEPERGCTLRVPDELLAVVAAKIITPSVSTALGGLYAAFVSSELETRHRERIAADLQLVTDVDGLMPKIKAVAMEFGVFVSMEGGEYMVVSRHPRPL